MQTTAVLWHINELSGGEPIALGGVGLVRIVPILIFSLIAGATADVVNRRRVMFITQSSLAALAAILGLLTLLGLDSIAVIYIIIALSGAFWAFDSPARQSLIPNLVPRDNLTNAFSLSSIASKFGGIVGPAFAGLVLANWGIEFAYLLNAISFFAVIIALIRMGPVPQTTIEQTMQKKPEWKGSTIYASVLDGLRFVVKQPIILSSMLLDFFATLFASFNTLLPIYAKEILHVGAQGYGYLAAAPSIGAAIVAGTLSFVKNINNQGRTLLWAVFGFGLSVLVFGLSRSYALSFFALAMTGVTDGASVIIRNTIRQLQTPDHLRGRTVSINMIFFSGGPHLGQLEAGLVAQLFGPVFAVVSGSIACLFASFAVAFRFPELRHYRGDEPVLAGASQVEAHQS
jgi:MFS family permease